jgi:ATPase subunit of ABC transporter with duplicated ATPase domains
MADPGARRRDGALIERFGEAQARFEALDGYALEARAREILGRPRLQQEMMDGRRRPPVGGWKMRAALARILLMRPSAMLLDEPSNHLDIESLIWLEHFLADYEGALVMTSHDREFMNRVVNRIVEIDGGELTSYSGDYDFYEAQRARARRTPRRPTSASRRSWPRRCASSSASRRRPRRRRRCSRGVKQLDKIEKLEPPKRRSTLVFNFPPCPRSGDDVVKIAGAAKRTADGDLRRTRPGDRRGERWAVMGVNGAGKSTLLKLVAGDSAPTPAACARRRRPPRLLRPARHGGPRAAAHRAADARATPSRSPTAARCAHLAGCFGFSGDDVDKTCRVALGRREGAPGDRPHPLRPPELLVLDEPTNHLDMATKEMLVRALADYEGTMLFVSHDRRFLAQLSNRVLELTADGPLPTAAAISNTSPPAATRPRACAERGHRGLGHGLPPASQGDQRPEWPRRGRTATPPAGSRRRSRARN